MNVIEILFIRQWESFHRLPAGYESDPVSFVMFFID